MPENKKNNIYKIIITVAIFWFLDFILHYTGVGESNYYYISKFGNAVLFATLFYFIFKYKEQWKKIIYSFTFGTYISFYYLISSYSGVIQTFFGIDARYTPPPFAIFGIILHPIFWWIFHSLAFYLGLTLSNYLIKNNSK